MTPTVTFSTNGSGTVTTTWFQLSNKTTSQISGPFNVTFAAAGTQSDHQNFWNEQGLEPGDSYRYSVRITSTSNPAISVMSPTMIVSSCASPPGYTAELISSPTMTAITPGALSIYSHTDIFGFECAVEATVPYSTNGSGTVQTIMQATSSSSIGSTYYDTSVIETFNGPGSISKTSYFRLPNLPGNGQYTIKAKLVEVSSSGSVSATTTAVTANCPSYWPAPY
jgi:hypothetical protein